MKIGSADHPQPAQEKIATPPHGRKGRFSNLLQNHISDHSIRMKQVSENLQTGEGSTRKNDGRVSLGTVTDKVPTVSDLLIRHPVYRKETWNIIQAAQNRNKPYTDIRPGTEIYLDPETLTLSWCRYPSRTSAALPARPQMIPEAPGSRVVTDEQTDETSGLIELGTISEKSPTVSHLLRQDATYRPAAYKIIHSKINRAKPYTRMVEGTRVYLDPETREIVWDIETEKTDPTAVAGNRLSPAPDVTPATPGGPDRFSENLAKSVAHFMGSPYEKMDCFELLVRGLNKMGVHYNGRGGLYSQLVSMALTRGLPENAYLNGEGLIAASGTRIYSKSMPRIENAASQADKIYKEMEPHLNKGFVLSFSTKTRGHTGIVSQKDDLWTYINSGTMDHDLRGGHDPKGVGEEVLADEIRNWVTIAARSRQPLRITLGRLNAQKLPGIET